MSRRQLLDAIVDLIPWWITGGYVPRGVDGAVTVTGVLAEGGSRFGGARAARRPFQLRRRRENFAQGAPKHQFFNEKTGSDYYQTCPRKAAFRGASVHRAALRVAHS